jgi:hypothetical protein
LNITEQAYRRQELKSYGFNKSIHFKYTVRQSNTLIEWTRDTPGQYGPRFTRGVEAEVAQEEEMTKFISHEFR